MSAADERPVVAELRAAKDAKAPKGRAKSLLPSAAPPPGAPREEVAGWLTAALGLGGDPVARAERYGRTVDARLVVVLDSGRRFTFERAADAFEGGRLVAVVMLATGCQMPAYGRADALHVAGSIIRLAELHAEADERGEAAEWGATFLAAAARNRVDVADLASPHGRWEALCILASWTPPAELPSYAPAGERAALVADEAGAMMVRTSDFAGHARHMAGRPIAWASLHGRMSEVGWEHPGELQQRQPGGQGKRKARVYVIPPAWEHE
ncbi:MAG: hypothetical protein ACR2LH_10770 [Thermoleophilaceae bacterium]